MDRGGGGQVPTTNQMTCWYSILLVSCPCQPCQHSLHLSIFRSPFQFVHFSFGVSFCALACNLWMTTSFCGQHMAGMNENAIRLWGLWGTFYWRQKTVMTKQEWADRTLWAWVETGMGTERTGSLAHGTPTYIHMSLFCSCYALSPPLSFFSLLLTAFTALYACLLPSNLLLYLYISLLYVAYLCNLTSLYLSSMYIYNFSVFSSITRLFYIACITLTYNLLSSTFWRNMCACVYPPIHNLMHSSV